MPEIGRVAGFAEPRRDRIAWGDMRRVGVFAGFVLLLGGCPSTPVEVAESGSDPTTTAMATTSGPATSGSADATAGPMTGDATSDGTTSGTSAGTTMAVDPTSSEDTTMGLEGTTTAPGGTTSGTTSGPSESSDDGMATTTGAIPECHPLLVEVFYDTQSGENNEQWIKLFNDCPDPIDLNDYSLGWGGSDYTVGTLDLESMALLAPDDCFIVGGPQSEDDNANPMLDQAIDLDPDLEKSGGTADGVALFYGDAVSIMPDTVPVDAVIYGGNNSSMLIDETGVAPMPHVGDAGDTDSIRRDALDSWIIEDNAMPGLCPPF